MSLTSGTSPTSGIQWYSTATDGLVGGVVDVGRVIGQPPARLSGYVVKERSSALGRHIHARRQATRRRDRLLGPLAGVHVVDGRLPTQQVHRDHLELQRGAALEEQHVVAVGDVQQPAQVRLGLGSDRDELLTAVGHLHHRLTRTCQSSISSAACASTSSGRTAGPALKLYTRVMGAHSLAGAGQRRPGRRAPVLKRWGRRPAWTLPRSAPHRGRSRSVAMGMLPIPPAAPEPAEDQNPDQPAEHPGGSRRDGRHHQRHDQDRQHPQRGEGCRYTRIRGSGRVGTVAVSGRSSNSGSRSVEKRACMAWSIRSSSSSRVNGRRRSGRQGGHGLVRSASPIRTRRAAASRWRASITTGHIHGGTPLRGSPRPQEVCSLRLVSALVGALVRLGQDHMQLTSQFQ